MLKNKLYPFLNHIFPNITKNKLKIGITNKKYDIKQFKCYIRYFL